MPKSYVNCGPEVEAIAARVRARYMRELDEAGVTVRFQYVYPAVDEATGEPKGPALKHAGFPAAAIVRLNPLPKRVEGLTDATVSIDGEGWKALSPRQREALIAHELRHLQLVTDDEGHVQVDDAGRPRLRLRPHDHQVGVFLDVASWYGQDAGEVAGVEAIVREFRQPNFFDDEEVQPLAATA